MMQASRTPTAPSVPAGPFLMRSAAGPSSTSPGATGSPAKLTSPLRKPRRSHGGKAGRLLSQAWQAACFGNVARVLGPGGVFVIECFAPANWT